VAPETPVPASTPRIESRTGLDPWGKAELPLPPDTRGLRILKVVGPGAIVLGASIGSGEWLIGPSVFVRYGLSLLWVTLLAVAFQTLFNTELVRYTLYTGESAFTGFMRTKPHATFWGWFYALLYFLQNGWPAWAGASAGAFFFLAMGRAAGPGEAGSIYAVGLAAYAACVLLLLFGGRRIEHTLEILNWVMVIGIFLVLGTLCLVFARPSDWAAAALGFAGYDAAGGVFRLVPEGTDWFLLASFAAFSGCGGVTNITLSNWARDKGYGMGGVVGFIPTLVGGQEVRLAHTGSVFEPTPGALERWRGWWRIVGIDQWGIFFLGALVGMALPGILYTAVMPRGTDLRNLNIASELARALSERGGPALALIVAIMSAWILFKVQLDIVEATVRSLTDILWSASRHARSLTDVRRVYYAVLATVVLWGAFALSVSQPIVLLELAANVAGVVMTVAALHILRVNTTLLPPALRPPLWRRLGLVLMSVFYGGFVWLWLMGGLVPNPAKGLVFTLLPR
jgi:hypothetical protein